MAGMGGGGGPRGGGSVSRSRRGGGKRAEARCAQAVAGTSPTPGGGGARPGRRANEVRGSQGPPQSRTDLGNPPARHLQPHSPGCARSAARGIHAAPEERSPRDAWNCSPRPPAGATRRPKVPGGAAGGCGCGVGDTMCLCRTSSIGPRPAARLPTSPALELRGYGGEVKRYLKLPLENEGTNHAFT